jgi:Ca2+-binding RTX toxin-like protein
MATTTDFLQKRGADDIAEGNVNDDSLRGRSSDDFLRGRSGDDALWGNLGDDRLFGGSGRDKVYGGSGKDKMWGAAGDDRLYGGLGDDLIRGGLGADVIDGGKGRDVMSGGAGADTFVFRSVKDSGMTSAKRDYISDFTAQDIVNLAKIDADTTQVGNQDFRFIGDDAFTGVAGQLHYREIKSGGKEFTLLEADRNGDGVADFQIALAGHIHITSANLFGDL